MAQVRKDEVERAIARAALSVFAERGFVAATMSDIAAAAGVSTGNLYRYHSGKEQLLEAVIPAALPRRLTDLLRARVETFGPAAPAPSHVAASDALMTFTLAHRSETVFLLARAAGSRYAAFPAASVDALVASALARLRVLAPKRRLSDAERFVLRRSYENLVSSSAAILSGPEDDAGVRAAVAAYTRYHLGGLSQLLGL